MRRSKKILVVCHCLLNANAKVVPLAQVGGVYVDVLRRHIEDGVGLLQLPCPELSYLGVNRWGMTKEQYDHPNFRWHCERILEPAVNQMQAFLQAGYDIVGIVGMDGSPNCGVRRTCLGYTGGEIPKSGDLSDQVGTLRMTQDAGVFMEVLQAVLKRRGMSVPFLAVDEEGPSNDTSTQPGGQR